MFKFGDVVTFIEGIHEGITGVIWKKPSKENLNHYTVITEDRPYGYWATEDELAMSFEESSSDYKSLCKTKREAIYAIKLRNEEYDKFIPEDEDPDKFIGEMADINRKFTKNAGFGFIVLIEPKEGTIPHVHVCFHDGKIAHVKLGTAEYLNGHKSKDYILSRSDCKHLQEFFEAKMMVKDQSLSKMNSWEFAVSLWESYLTTKEEENAFENAFKYDKDGNKIMPDYTKLQ